MMVNDGPLEQPNHQSMADPVLLCLASVAVGGLLVSSALAVIKMSGRKAPLPPSPDTAAQPKRSKKVRSISVSVDLDCKSGSAADSNKHSYYFLRSLDRNRTVSECVGANKSSIATSPILGNNFATSPLTAPFLATIPAGIPLNSQPVLPATFPFYLLPEDCKVRVFSFLTHIERGEAALVCREWCRLVQDARLWTVVDLTAFPSCNRNCGATGANDDCLQICYPEWRDKVKSFISYLIQIRPVLKRLRIALDIGDHEDAWLECLQELIAASRLQELEYLHLNWKETPNKPLWESNLTWSTSDARDLMYKHRYRQRIFVQFFETISVTAKNLRQLVLPFDWSERSLRALKRLPELRYLSLEKYFLYQPMKQEMLDQLLDNVPHLKQLILEIWTPSSKGLQCFRLHAPNLHTLDMLQCRGLYLSDARLPKLHTFKMTRNPWSGPLVSPDAASIPCIYQVLCEGCPALRLLNEHSLKPEWKDVIYPELQVVLNHICSCHIHKSTGWVNI